MNDTHLDTPIGAPGKIQTYIGRLVDPFNLNESEVHIEDIAHALSQLCRFTGHTRRFYSVGEHCLLVAGMLGEYTPRIALAGLVHDAGEAYFGDMAGPMKRRIDMGEYNTAEHRAAAMITRKYCGELTQRERSLVKDADARAYHIERAQLIRPGFMEPYEVSDFSVTLGNVPVGEIEHLYLQLFWGLYNSLQH